MGRDEGDVDDDVEVGVAPVAYRENLGGAM